MRIRLCFLFALFLVFATALGAQDTTVELLRHAERQSLLDDDSPLAPAGLRRAQAMVPTLAVFHPSVLFASSLQRTQRTLGPLSASLGLKLLIRPKEASEALAGEILRDHRGQTVIVCWHHDLMKKLVRGLGVKGPVPYWSLGTYDHLWVVRVPAKGEASLEERQQELDVR